MTLTYGNEPHKNNNKINRIYATEARTREKREKKIEL